MKICHDLNNTCFNKKIRENSWICANEKLFQRSMFHVNGEKIDKNKKKLEFVIQCVIVK